MRFDDVLEAIGDTPLVGIPRMTPKPGVRLWAKLEGQNPTGSLEGPDREGDDRGAEASGELTPRRTILEPTSGNTGIALAMVARRKGYRLTVVIPDNASEERIRLLELFGAEIVLSPGDRGTNGAIEVARAAREDERYFMPFQYGNPANPRAHDEATGDEIVRDLPEITHFVAGLGTGGTLTGVGRALQRHDPGSRSWPPSPSSGTSCTGCARSTTGSSPRSSTERARPEVPRELRRRPARDARAHRERGVFAGISSGAVVHVAQRIAPEIERGDVVCLLADGGWKYLSTEAWAPELERAEKNRGGGIAMVVTG